MTTKEALQFWPVLVAVVLFSVSWGVLGSDIEKKAEKTDVELVKQDIKRLKEDTDEQKKIIKSVDDRLRSIETNVALIAQSIKKDDD